MEIVYDPHRTVPLEEFHSEILFEFPDIPDSALDAYILKAARTLAQNGKVIRRESTVETWPHVPNYLLRSPDGLEICGILGAKIDRCGCCTSLEVPRLFEEPSMHCDCGCSKVWYDDRNKEINILHPVAPAQYRFSLAVCPSRTACALPAEMYDDYLEILITGVKANLLLVTGKPWSNLPLGNAYLTEFRNRISDAAVERLTHKQRGRIHMRFGAM